MVGPSPEKINDIRKRGFRPQAVGCILNKDKKLLLLFKREYRLWQLPQGGIENWESVNQALTRELTEELGEKFMNRCLVPKELILKFDQVEFPLETRESRKLISDEGEEILLRGKAYFFCLLRFSGDIRLNIKNTEFDDYIWASYEQAESLARQIYQPGKRRITLSVLKALQRKDLIK